MTADAAPHPRGPGRRSSGHSSHGARRKQSQGGFQSGGDGALFFANGRPPVRVPAPAVDRVIDGTGAGDAFIAGFLPAWLDKKPPAEALSSGCRLAAHALNLIGARPVL